MSQDPGSADLKAMGRRIAELREAKGWTQPDLAKQADLSVTFLSEIENGRRNISSGKLLGIADALDTTMDYLARGSHGVPRSPALTKVPRELTDAAEAEGWTFTETRALLEARELILERRTTAGGEVKRVYGKQDWIDLYRELAK